VAVTAWGILGILALLTQAVVRLTPLAVEAARSGELTWLHLSVGAAWLLWMGYAEGYKGFQRSFSPRVVARAMHLARHRRPLHVALAPLFCMGFFHASRRVLILAWGVSLGVIALIVLVHMVPQPWRGVIDAGVVFGLAWGAASVLLLWLQALRNPASANGHAGLPEAAPTPA
jgi:hypothetical protein